MGDVQTPYGDPLRPLTEEEESDPRIQAAASRHDDIHPADTYNGDLLVAREMLRAADRAGSGIELKDGWKTPEWDETPVTIPRRLLQECELALSDVRGLVQRMESMPATHLDSRDRRAVEWGRAALANLRGVLSQ